MIRLVCMIIDADKKLNFVDTVMLRVEVDKNVYGNYPIVQQ